MSSDSSITPVYNMKGGYYEVYGDDKEPKIVTVAIITEKDEIYTYEIENDTIRKDLIKKFQDVLTKKKSDE